MLPGLLSVFLTLASCSPSAPTPQAGGGIGGTGSVATVASGPVTKFGSVFISGTEYDNAKTIYCIDDEPCSSENKLKIGMVVLVNGKVTEDYSTNQPVTRTADTITYEETVEGIVQSVAPDGSSLEVLGQSVTLNQKTEIDPAFRLIPDDSHILDPHKVLGVAVEVSGFVTGNGRILATLIMPQTSALHYEVQGKITNLKTMAKQFEIGALIIDYSDPSVDLSHMPPATSSWDGVVVHVRGDSWDAKTHRLSARRIKPLSLGIDTLEDAEVEGFILRADAPGDFYVNNLHVQTTAATVFEGGVLADLIVGTHVEIHGRLTNGMLEAGQISFEGDLELESNVASIDLAANTFTLAGLSGLTVRVDSKTAIDGEGNLRRIEDLRIGDHLKIHGRLIGSNLKATELERSGPAAAIKIEAPVQSSHEPLLVMAGATIDTSDIPDSGFIGRYGAIGRSAFFQGLTIGKKASLKGASTATGVIWTSAKLNE